jgi:TetR/AcrR family transcriptional repressor of nem operon
MDDVAPPDSRTRLLHAALRLVRRQGWAATSVDALCAEAGVTKGSFFHHFRSKEALGVAAAALWGETSAALFAAAPYHDAATPVARVLAYVDFRAALLAEDLGACTCFAGTLVQETWASHPALRDACGTVIAAHAATLEADLAAARPEGADWDPASVARFTQTVLQGAFVMAKASGSAETTGSAETIREQVGHLRRYLGMLLGEKQDVLF